MRFLPNPFYIEELRSQTGNDKAVYDYVMEQPETQEFIKKTIAYYDYLLKKYEEEGKMQMIIGIGCTGGQHRSVTLTNYFAEYYSQFYQVYKWHRDADQLGGRKMISFSRVVKEEIVFNDFDSLCEKAILCAMVKIIGTLSLNQLGLSLSLRTENAKIASKLHKILKKLYNPHIEFLVSRKMKLKKNNVYVLKVSKAREILEDLQLMDGIGFHTVPDKTMLKTDEESRAYLAGVFLACGSVNNPETSNYHLEMSVNEEEYADFVQGLMNQYQLNAKVIKRRNKYVIYLKSAEKIGDFLRAIGASQSVMSFEMTRIDRSMANTVNRWNNCDIANEVKAMSASQAQIEDIAYVMDKAGLEVLDDRTQKIAILRLENPELTLNELATVYEEQTEKSISKSGLHRSFKKIKEEAEKLKQMENDTHGRH